MGKGSGLGDNFYIGGFDLSGDVTSLDSVSTPIGVADSTGISKLAHERLLMRRDGLLSASTMFNAAPAQTTGEHAALSSLPLTDVIASYLCGQALLNPAAVVNGKQLSYDPSMDASGNLTTKFSVQANGFGLEWCRQLTAGLRTDTTATTGPAIDELAGSVFGGQAYLHLVSLTGTNIDVKIRHATTAGGTYADLIDFGSLTAKGAVRASVANNTTVNEFLEVVTSGTFTNAVFAVLWNRNASAVVF